jgi:G:T-mismatch repair DNA endonuclease (very short patch repair protein)
MMLDKGELVTVAKIRQHLDKNVHDETVRKTMTSMGFAFKRRGMDVYVRERPDIVAWRIRFVFIITIGLRGVEIFKMWMACFFTAPGIYES